MRSKQQCFEEFVLANAKEFKAEKTNMNAIVAAWNDGFICAENRKEWQEKDEEINNVLIFRPRKKYQDAQG